MANLSRRVTSTLFSLRLAIVLIGFIATASQILVIRELLVVFHGSELTIGIILGSWLILAAGGSYYFRNKAVHIRRGLRWFSVLQILIGFSPLLSIAFIRSFRYLLGIPIGEVLGIHYVAVVGLVASAPVSVLSGMLFPFACHIIQVSSSKKEAPSNVYLYEGGGGFLSGLSLTLYLIGILSPIELSFGIALLSLSSVFLYLTFSRESSVLRNTATALILLISISFFLSVPKKINEATSKMLWYEYDLQETKNSVYSNIAIIKKNGQYTFFSNGSPYAVTPVPESYIEEISHFPMLFHDNPDDVLLIGSGAGGLIRETLKHPVKRIHYTEQDPLTIESFKRFPTPVTEYELNHPAVSTYNLEGRVFLRKTSSMYDLIAVNLPMPSTLQLNRNYTVEFFRLVSARLKEHGILSITLSGGEAYLSKQMRQLNRRLYASLKAVFPHVRVIVGDPNIFLASNSKGIETIGHEMLIKRLNSRKISAGLVNEQYIRYKMDSISSILLERSIIEQKETPNGDTNPLGVFDAQQALNLQFSPYMVRIMDMFSNIPFGFYIVLVACLTLILTVIQRSKRQLFIVYAIATTGLWSMLQSILLIMLFQIYYGYVYHYIGLLTSLFMLGLALGAFAGMKMVKIKLVLIESLILLITSLTYILILLELKPEILQPLIFCLIISSGFLTGISFPVAVRLMDSSYTEVSRVGGGLYAIDLFGAFFGALTTAVLFIPMMGINKTLFLVMAVKAGSLILVKKSSSLPS
ncbi:MAG: hypothetical protein HY805_03825 [Nitrospirae bacterium]|nr:hypothetical protein [Nitrospirota bacterium]